MRELTTARAEDIFGQVRRQLRREGLFPAQNGALRLYSGPPRVWDTDITRPSSPDGSEELAERLQSLYRSLDEGLASSRAAIGAMPEVALTLRGTVGRSSIGVLQRLLWWYTRSLKSFAGSVGTHLQGSVETIEVLSSILRINQMEIAALRNEVRRLRENQPKTREFPLAGSAPPVTIIILTWNGLAYTRRCLDSLRANTIHPSYRIVVVDNGSTDGTIEYLREQESSIHLIRNSANLGFSRANNIGIRSVPPDHDIVLLNNDTEITQPDWLVMMQKTALDSARTGIVGCRLIRQNGVLQHAGAYMPTDTFWGQQIGGGEREINQFNEDRDVESVVFACVYLKRAVLDSVGLLDEDYFCYFEDTDYCERASVLGFKTRCCGNVTLIHHENVSTRVNGTSHLSLFQRGQQIFRKKWEKQLLQNRYSRRAGWNSVLNFPTGYAISSASLAAALDQQGVQLSYKYLYGRGTTFPIDEPEGAMSPVIDAIRRRNLTSDLPQIVYGQADMFHANFGKYKVGFTMLETDRIPAEWARQANTMNEVWVPSRFNAETFRASGVTKPIHVIPLGVDPDYFNPKIARLSLPGVYTFLSIFEWGERKAPHILLKAFNDEFRADEQVILVVKTLNRDHGVDVEREVADLGLDPNGGKIHFSLNQVVPTYQLGVLYRSADCFVLTTRGEGWGMPVIEAMACGLPVIATDWSAHCDFMNDTNAYPLPVDALIPAQAKCPYYTGFRWAEPSYTHLRRLMRRVFNHQEEARAKGELASVDVRENWTWQRAAEKIIARLDAIKP